MSKNHIEHRKSFKSTEIRGEICLNSNFVVQSYSSRCVDLIGSSDCKRLPGEKFSSFLLFDKEIEGGRRHVIFEREDESTVALDIELFPPHLHDSGTIQPQFWKNFLGTYLLNCFTWQNQIFHFDFRTVYVAFCCHRASY